MKRNLTIMAMAMILAAGCSKNTEDIWEGSRWIAMDADKTNTMEPGQMYFHGNAPADSVWNDLGMYAMPQFRKEFTCPEEVESAQVHVSGLGAFELFVNGNKVGDHFLDPAWTRYDKEAAYVTFDLTGLLGRENAVGVMLGGGYFNIPNARYHKIVGSMGAPRMRLSMDIRYRNGSTQRIVSDSTWKASPSAVTFSSIYGGEDFDASAEQRGWKMPGFDDSSWKEPIQCSFSPEMTPQVNEPLSVRCGLEPVAITENAAGWLYDMGQNFSGIFRLEVSGPRGSMVKLTPAELKKDNMADQSSGGGPCWYGYTLSGDGTETWQPQFTYYGQRYFQVEGAVPEGQPNPKGLPVVKHLTGLHTCASVAQVGSFSCSEGLFDSILEMTSWAIRNNTASVMTDCPHREKLGWDEQLHLMFAACDYNYRLLNVYRNELDRMATAQREDGCIPTIAPEYVRFNGGFEDSPEWGASMVLMPWYIYRWYGDRSLIDRHYGTMQRFMEYLRSRKDDRGIVAYGLRDWLSTDPTDSPGITSHLTYVHCLDIMAKCAGLTGKGEDAEKYIMERKEAIGDFNRAFWDGETYDKGNQAANAMALYMKAVPEENIGKVYFGLLTSIRNRNYAVSVGEVAHPYLLEVLAQHGDQETIYRMHTQRHSPGYAWCIDHGATALPEAWDGGMSQTHFCLGHISKWFYECIGGIRQGDDDCGWKSVVVEPHPVGDLTWAECSFDSPSGRITSSWQRDGKKFTLQVTAPEGMQVEVVLPEGYESSYTLDRK